jgi:chromosome partitioning protein
LSAYLVKKKKKVLVIDLDPQCSLSDGYGVDYEDYPYTVHDLLQGNSGLRFKSKAENLYIMVGSPLLDTVQYESVYILRDRLKVLCQVCRDKLGIEFDYVIIDISPADLLNKYLMQKNGKKLFLPKLNQIALAAADFVVIPLKADRYSVKGLQSFVNDVNHIKRDYNPTLDIAGVFFSSVNVIENAFKAFYKTVEKQIPERYFVKDFIRKDVNISKAVEQGTNIFSIAPNSRSASDYKKVCKAIFENINK